MVLKAITCVRCESRHTFKMSEEQYAALQTLSSVEIANQMPVSLLQWVPLLTTRQCEACWIELEKEAFGSDA